MSVLRLGVIGYGARASDMADCICRHDPETRLVAVADPRMESVRQRLIEITGHSEGVSIYGTAEEMLDREILDGVVIGTRCGLHTAMSLLAIRRGLAVFLEKPVATNMADLMALRAASSNRTVVSFPLRTTPLVKLAREIIDSGRVGSIEHVQAQCNVPYGAVYFQTWYRDESETQGMFLQKATHDFDYINYLLAGNRPVEICAMTSKQVFKGNRPAGKLCTACDERTTCFESPYHRSRTAPLALDMPSTDMCAFAVDTGNEDSGSALIRYDSGMHVSYSQNFVVRRTAGSRGARLIGYHGTIEFDWFTNKLQVKLHHSPRVETYKFDGDEAHGGGDANLAENFVGVMRGTAQSVSPLSEAVLNALMCLKAKESARTRAFEQIEFPAVGEIPGSVRFAQSNSRRSEAVAIDPLTCSRSD
jgi:predicted dehydrogenase